MIIICGFLALTVLIASVYVKLDVRMAELEYNGKKAKAAPKAKEPVQTPLQLTAVETPYDLPNHKTQVTFKPRHDHAKDKDY